MCGAEQGFPYSPAGYAWDWDGHRGHGCPWGTDYPHCILGVLPSSETSQSAVKPKARQLLVGYGACTPFSPLQLPFLPRCRSDSWVTKMLTPLWLLSYHIIPVWGAVTSCPSCMGEGGPLELTAEGTGCLTRWAWGKGAPGWVPWGAGQGRVAREGKKK